MAWLLPTNYKGVSIGTKLIFLLCLPHKRRLVFLREPFKSPVECFPAVVSHNQDVSRQIAFWLCTFNILRLCSAGNPWTYAPYCAYRNEILDGGGGLPIKTNMPQQKAVFWPIYGIYGTLWRAPQCSTAL